MIIEEISSIFFLLLYLFAICVVLLNTKKGSIFSFNAFSTTMMQTMFSLFLSSSKEAVCIYLAINFVFDQFQGGIAIHIYNILNFAAVIHVIGAAFNVAFIWSELTAFRRIKIIQNIKNTKGLLWFFVASMYAGLIYSEVFAQGHSVLQAILAFYIVTLMIL